MMMVLSLPPVFFLQILWRVLVVALMLPGISHATDWDIDQLMQGLALKNSGRASFVETKNIAMLDKPVESSGELFYTAPDHLEKRTLKPKAESMTVDADNLAIERGSRKYHLKLQDYPELRAFIDSIRGTLAGDRKALERNYRLSLDGSAEYWILQLRPVDEKMQAVVECISISGVQDVVRSIEVAQADGDSSLMLIEQLGAP